MGQNDRERRFFYDRIGVLLVAATLVATVFGQFTNRYPKVKGYSHHIYLEGYDLPIFSIGPVDPAPSPDGASIVVASRGWLWILDPVSGEAKRLTQAAGIDSRPTWSPDGKTLAFVRDDTRDTSIMAINPQTGEERRLLNTPAIDLDPAFSRDGKWLYYSSAAAGDLDLWRMELASGDTERLTQEDGLELRPLPLPDGKSLVYVHKTRRGNDEVRRLDLEKGGVENLRSVSIGSQTRPALSPDGSTLALALPSGNTDWQLYLLDLGNPVHLMLIDTDSSLPVTPAWSADGTKVFFADADRTQTFALKSVPATGGETLEHPVTRWNWGVPTRLISVRTTLDGEKGPVAARLSAWDASGHPLVAEAGQPRFDSQNGRVYFYSPGVVDLEAPPGTLRLAAVRGLSTPEVRVEVETEKVEAATVSMKRLWDPRQAGYYSGDHHFHLNYGGPYSLRPEDLLPLLKGEELDVATPLVANLNNRPQDLKWLSWRSLDHPPLIAFGQEVRAHFLGHVGLFGIATPFWPWFWGPGYPVYGRDDRPNAEALRHARRQGGVNTYVHPVTNSDPFSDGNLGSIPLELIPDALLGDLDGLEVACLWSDELGSSQIWHRLLNFGVNIVPTAGTDAFPGFYRSMAVGSTRVYVRLRDPLNLNGYLESLKKGHSFVSTGPLMDFQIDGLGPGDVVKPSEDANWKLDLYSATAVETVEILVNGSVVAREKGLQAAGSASYSGSLQLPVGGWVAARAYGGPSGWPVMDSYPFAHTAPVWIGQLGSTAPESRRQAAADLLKALTVAEERLRQGYGETPNPVLRERFARARSLLSR